MDLADHYKESSANILREFTDHQNKTSNAGSYCDPSLKSERSAHPSCSLGSGLCENLCGSNLRDSILYDSLMYGSSMYGSNNNMYGSNNNMYGSNNNIYGSSVFGCCSTTSAGGNLWKGKEGDYSSCYSNPMYSSYQFNSSANFENVFNMAKTRSMTSLPSSSKRGKPVTKNNNNFKRCLKDGNNSKYTGYNEGCTMFATKNCNPYSCCENKSRRCKSWRDENVYDRINTLAQPKKIHGIDGNTNVNRFTVNICGGDFRIKRAGPDYSRLDRLAQPRTHCGEWCGRSIKENQWECGHPFDKRYCINNQLDPSKLHMSRATHVCVPCQEPKDAATKISKAALNAVASRRLEKLSVPKTVVDSGQYYLWLLNKKPDNEAKLKSVKKLSIHKVEMAGERILLRCDLDHSKDEPSIETKVDRIRLTAQYCLNRNAKAVIIASHCGKPRCRLDMKYSLKKVSEMLAEGLNKEVVFLDDCIGPEAQALCEDPEPGSVFVLENLRFYPEEEGYSIDTQGTKIPCTKEEIQAFRARLFALGDIFILDDFKSLVNMSNTTIGSQKQERAYGWNVFFELSKYNTFITNPVQPTVAVIGGPFNDKIDMVYNIMGKAQEILLGGEIAQIFLKTLKGIDIGVTKSLPDKEKRVLTAMSRAKDIACVVNLPSDFVVRNTKKPEDYFTVTTKLDVEPMFEIVDIGKVTRSCYLETLRGAKSIVWSGDLGILLDGTSEIANAINNATANGVAGSFIMDEETEQSFKTLVPNGKVTAVTGDGHVMSMLLKTKLPKGLAALSPYQKKSKKRLKKDEILSLKPANINKPGYSMTTGFQKLCIDQVDVENKTVMVVCNLTAPLYKERVADNYSLRMVIPTIKFVLQRGARLVIIASPFIRKDKKNELQSLKPMAVEMEKLLGRRVTFTDSSGVKVQKAIEQTYKGGIIMLENIYFNKEEHYSFMMDELPGSSGRRPSPENIAVYCQTLSKMCDVWVNDAFSFLNEDRARVTGCMHKQRPCGFLVKNELKYLSKTFNSPPRKFLAIIGGANVHRSMDVMRGLLRDADEMILTGILGLHLLSVHQGMRLGLSFDRSIQRDELKALLDMANENKVRLYYPVDIITTTDLEDARDLECHSTSDGIAAGCYFVDIGPKTISLFSRIIKRSKLVLWIGVIGLCTLDEFKKGTRAVYDTIVKCTQDPEIGQISVVGGQYLSTFVHNIDPNHEGLSHVTTGPYVMLQMMSEKNTVGLDTITHNSNARVSTMNRLSIDQCDLKDKRIMIRMDCKLPTSKSQGQDDNEYIKQMAGFIRNVLKKGATCVLLCGHYGNPKGSRDDVLSLNAVKIQFEKLLRAEVQFFDNVNETLVSTMKAPELGKVYMLENMRFNPAEVGYFFNNNDQRINIPYEDMDTYRSKLSKMCDLYVCESMEALHTTDASVVGIEIDDRVTGPFLKKELDGLSKLIPKIQHPILSIVGGSDDIFEKTKLIYDIIDMSDTVIVCGRTALNFLKVTKNMPIGKDTIDKQAVKLVHRCLKKASVQNVKLQLPVDFNCLIPADPAEEESEDTTKSYSVAEGIPENQRAIDIGDDTMDIFIKMIQESNCILYTGAMGLCNTDLGSVGTRAVLETMSMRTSEAGAVTIAFGTQISGMCLHNLEESQGLSHISRGSRTVIDLIMGRPLPGLEALTIAPPKTLPVLTMEQIALKGKKILLRLDLDVPTVEGIVLNTDKIESALKTIKYILNKDPLCLILAGSRGNPKGYKNNYLSMKPLAMELEHFLETPVTFIEEPCSRKARIMCEDPPPGTVFLMENLKFYPAEVGIDDEMPDLLDDSGDEATNSASQTNVAGMKRKSFQTKNTAYVPAQNIDKCMWELMPFKSVENYTREIGDCCEIYINDDVEHIHEDLTSNLGFDLNDRACGFRMFEYLQSADFSTFAKLPAVEALSPAPAPQ